ncbi:MAG: PIG-L family deacetylase, partial [Bacteroidota bacterium]
MGFKALGSTKNQVDQPLPVYTIRPADVPRRVVVAVAHPDDETLGAGAAIAAHVQAGDHVRIIVATDGEGSRAGGLNAEHMRRVRRDELHRALESLGVTEVSWLGHPDGRLDAGSLAKVLAGQI